MALLYRAMWSDDAPDGVETAFSTFGAWTREKSGGRLDPPAEGSARTDEGDAEVRVERSTGGGTDGVDDALVARFVEHRDDGSQWTTTLRACSGHACADPDPDARVQLWVDIENETDDDFRHISIRAPRLVRTMLDRGRNPRRNGLPLSDRPRIARDTADAEALAELVTGASRDLPVVVFTGTDGGTSAEVNGPALRTAYGVAGMAAVHLVVGPAIDALEAALTSPYAVRDGAMRIYLPNVDPALDDDWRHRYVLPERFVTSPETAVRLAVGQAAPAALSRRAHRAHALARAELRRAAVDGQAGEATLMVKLLEEENELLSARVETVRDEGARLRQRYADLLEDHEELQEERASLQGRLKRALSKLTELGQAGADAPDRATHPSKAVEQAREYLGDHLVLPDGAVVDIELLDSAPESRTWGQSLWKGFLALHAYAATLASTGYDGTFWTWCENSDDPRKWPATTKKLAMTESESVQKNKRMSDARSFPVHADVHPDGRIEMLAHLKIAEGGGNIIPRVYFHVDEKRGRVHVGFVGPHKHLRNTKT